MRVYQSHQARKGVADEVAEQRSGDLNELHNALDGSFNNAPSQLDGEPYVPFLFFTLEMEIRKQKLMTDQDITTPRTESRHLHITPKLDYDI